MEYKGELTGATDDIVVKTTVGKLWANQNPSKYIYATIYGSGPDGLTVEQQLERAFE